MTHHQVPMCAALKRLVAPLFLRVDFTEACWNDAPRALIAWVGLAVGMDLVVQWASGMLAWWSVALALLTATMLASLPTRLASALAGLYVTQAAVSYGLLQVALVAGWSESATEVMLWGWQGWCFAAFALLVLRYIRTPRAAMR